MAFGHSGDLPFVLAANRDEFYARETAPAGFWRDQPHVLGGRDLEQGGTWLAVGAGGKFAALTNFRQGGENDPSARSRGLLIPDFLKPGRETVAFTRQLEQDAQLYNGFNLIYGELPDRLYYFSNRSGQPPRLLEPGVYALSNHLLDTDWPKVVRGKQEFERIISSPNSELESRLFELLADTRKAREDELPDTGIDKHLEHLLSSIFIQSERYGTRCSTVLTVNARRQLGFSELTYDPGHHAKPPPVRFTCDLETVSRPQ